MNENNNAVLETVGEHLERITRFDAKDIQLLKPEADFLLPVNLELTQNVSYSINSQRGAARLPSNVVVVGDANTMHAISSDALALAQQQAPDTLQDWVDQDVGRYLRLIPGNAVFRASARAHGYEHRCVTCNGACSVVCPNCSGDGQNRCTACKGAGKIPCYTCHGSRKKTCDWCQGKGRWTESVSYSQWDASRNQNVTNYRTENKFCSHCTGSGITQCTNCNYEGKIICQPCTGNGFTPCLHCGRTGRVNCRDCSASGIQHEWQIVVATVDVTENLLVSTSDQNLSAIVHNKIALDALPGYGKLLATQHKVKDTLIESLYVMELQLCQADIQASSRQFLIYGFGSNKSVVDFANIAGELLEVDLNLLEVTTLRASRWRLDGNALVESVSKFVASELNLLIAEQCTSNKSGKDAVFAQVEAHFNGLVDARYIKRSADTLEKALTKVYSAEMTKPSILFCLIAVPVFCLLFLAGLLVPKYTPITMLLSTLLLIAGWWALERRAQKRIAQYFPGEFGTRVLERIRHSGTIKRWRIAMAVVVILTMVGILFAVNSIEQNRETTRAQANLTLSEHKAASVSNSLSGRWTGRYTCAQGSMGLRLELAQSPSGKVEGSFNFFPLNGAKGTSGSFLVSGPFSQGTLMLKGGQWLGPQPSNWTVVDLQLAPKAGNSNTLSGRILTQGCSVVEVRRSN